MPPEELQNKGGRYYFGDVSGMWPGNIYISRFDLNMEQGEIEKPYNPVLRFAIPSHGAEDTLNNILVLNVSGASILSMFSSEAHEGDITPYLLNGEGYWIKGPAPSMEWGSMIPDRSQLSFSAQYPDEWSKMVNSDHGTMQTENGIFSFRTISPASIIDRHFASGSGYEAEKWRIVSHVPHGVIENSMSTLLWMLWSFFIPLAAILIGGSIMLVKRLESIMMSKQEILEQHVSSERFIPRDFLQLMGKEKLRDIELSQSVQKNMTVLFSDIRSYTSLSESMHPQDVFHLLNDYFSSIDTAITARHGFIDKFIGDAVMALFTGSVDDALRASIAMHNRIDQFNMRQEQAGRPVIHSGFGIHFGEVSLGSMGTMRRMQTTAIGDTVNIAARIESATKSFKTDVILSDAVYDRVEQPALFRLRKIDTVRVKGKEQPISLYELYDIDEPELAKSKDSSLQDFNKALELYQLGDFDGALELFQKCADICPEDAIPPIYIKRCHTMKRINPGDEWTGVSTV